jgi:hypothetical protein
VQWWKHENMKTWKHENMKTKNTKKIALSTIPIIFH